MTQDPELMREAQVAIDIIYGKRPGIEEKYDALLLKLDRTYSSLLDKRDSWRKTAEETTLHGERLKAKINVSVLNKMLTDIQWMKARNRDMLEAISKPKGQS